ncbi:AtpZ/AtpI family protein [Yoonia sp. R2331]|uniref:AtpZ/AtpI family protein n=1 Tax=Yoonia sp. R2331 TaxID=3237238 RepID=UPI0034E5D1E1
MSDDKNPADDKARLAALEAKLAERRAPAEVKHHSEEHYSQAQLAWRMVIELVAGLGIGFGIGYGLDRLFGTTPIFLVLFIFFGLAAGIQTMLRSAKEVQRKQLAREAGEQEDETRGD